MPLIYLVAGEASGDVLGARLMIALRRLCPDVRFAGVGGARMAEQGFFSLFPMRDLAVMGLIEILPRLRQLRARLNQTVGNLAIVRPDVVVTIDSPGFTLRLLRRAAALGLPRVHYAAPQAWAWKERRVRHFPGLWDALLCLLPFEPAFFARHGLAATFVGHPVLESGADRGDGRRFRAAHGLSDSALVLILMPGSRRSEVPRLLPVFRHTLELLSRRVPDVVAVMPVSAIVAPFVQAAISRWNRKPLIVTELQDKHDAYAAAATALTKSGTSTLELALAGVPMAVTYRVNPITAMIARRMIKVPYVAMINLLAGRQVVPELLQEQCTPRHLADAVHGLLRDPEIALAQRTAFRTTLASLRPAGVDCPSEAAARAILRLLE